MKNLRLKSARAAKDLSQQQLADMLERGGFLSFCGLDAPRGVFYNGKADFFRRNWFEY